MKGRGFMALPVPNLQTTLSWKVVHPAAVQVQGILGLPASSRGEFLAPSPGRKIG